MTVVRIIKDWKNPNLLRQTFNGAGIWDGIQFTLDDVSHFDYAIVLNHVPEGTSVQCDRAHLWAMMQEPPIPQNRWRMQRLDGVAHIVTQDATLQGERYIHSHGALPWFVNKSYDELVNAPPPEKKAHLSWITSNKAFYPGHRQRLSFLRRVQREVDFDLWGHGFTPLADKWDGLAPYRYSLAIENYEGADYWTEKVADCFLSWTMPLYFGCTNLEYYFPKESFVHIDIHAPDVFQQINEIIKSNRWQKRLEAIAHARDLVLNHYQLFPFVTDLIQRQRTCSAATIRQVPDVLTLNGTPKPYSRTLPHELRHFLRRIQAKFKNL